MTRFAEVLFASRRSVAIPLLRIVICGWLAIFRGRAEGMSLARNLRRPLELLDAPLLDALHVPVPPPQIVVDLAPSAFVVLAGLGLIGLATRPALITLCCLWTYVGAIDSGFGFTHHTPALAAQLLWVVALVPGATSFSVDRLAMTWWRRRRESVAWWDGIWPACPRSGEYVAVFVIAFVYFASGVAKLRYDGASWMSGETLQFYLQGVQKQLWFGPRDVENTLRFKDGFGIAGYLYLARETPLAQMCLRIPGFAFVGAWATLAIELGAPIFLLLLGAGGRAAFLVAAFIFHGAIALLMGPQFEIWLACLLAIQDWPEVVRRVRSRRRRLS